MSRRNALSHSRRLLLRCLLPWLHLPSAPGVLFLDLLLCSVHLIFLVESLCSHHSKMIHMLPTSKYLYQAPTSPSSRSMLPITYQTVPEGCPMVAPCLNAARKAPWAPRSNQLHCGLPLSRTLTTTWGFSRPVGCVHRAHAPTSKQCSR